VAAGAAESLTELVPVPAVSAALGVGQPVLPSQPRVALIGEWGQKLIWGEPPGLEDGSGVSRSRRIRSQDGKTPGSPGVLRIAEARFVSRYHQRIVEKLSRCLAARQGIEIKSLLANRQRNDDHDQHKRDCAKRAAEAINSAGGLLICPDCECDVRKPRVRGRAWCWPRP
jgi:hypothetical protein